MERFDAGVNFLPVSQKIRMTSPQRCCKCWAHLTDHRPGGEPPGRGGPGPARRLAPSPGGRPWVPGGSARLAPQRSLSADRSPIVMNEKSIRDNSLSMQSPPFPLSVAYQSPIMHRAVGGGLNREFQCCSSRTVTYLRGTWQAHT